MSLFKKRNPTPDRTPDPDKELREHLTKLREERRSRKQRRIVGSDAKNNVVSLFLTTATTNALRRCLAVYDSESTCATWHNYTKDEVSEFLKSLSWHVASHDRLSVAMSHDQAVMLHCVVASADITWTPDAIALEDQLREITNPPK